MKVSQKLEEYIENSPSVKDCLSMGLINHSALARKFCDDSGLKKNSYFDAALISSRRYQEKIKLTKTSESKILVLLKSSKLLLKTKMAAIVISNKIQFSAILSFVKELGKQDEEFHLIQGPSSMTLICSDEFMDLAKKSFGHFLISKKKKLVELSLKSGKDLEELPGVMQYLYTKFGQNGINIVETMSSWTDTLFVVDEKDSSRAMQLLSF